VCADRQNGIGLADRLFAPRRQRLIRNEDNSLVASLECVQRSRHGCVSRSTIGDVIADGLRRDDQRAGIVACNGREGLDKSGRDCIAAGADEGDRPGARTSARHIAHALAQGRALACLGC
jgi:hypothetical protein